MNIATRRKCAFDICMNNHTIKAMSEYSYRVTQAVKDELQRQRRAANLSQREMGERLGISRQAVFARLSRGQLKFEDFISISKVLNLSPIDVLEHALTKTEKSAIDAGAHVN